MMLTVRRRRQHRLDRGVKRALSQHADTRHTLQARGGVGAFPPRRSSRRANTKWTATTGGPSELPDSERPGEMDIIVRKYRQGRLGMVTTRIDSRLRYLPIERDGRV